MRPLRYLNGRTPSPVPAEARHYDADGLGSITSLSNAAGALAQTYTYDSFGNTTNSSGSLTNFFQYTGREYDTETNLYFYRARYYDSSLGRFLTEDPLDFDGDGTNFYDYALNDPNVFVDPYGLWHCVADADCNFTPEFKKGLDRFQLCMGQTGRSSIFRSISFLSSQTQTLVDHPRSPEFSGDLPYLSIPKVLVDRVAATLVEVPAILHVRHPSPAGSIVHHRAASHGGGCYSRRYVPSAP